MDTTLPRVTTEFTYRGLDAVFLENEALRVMVLPGKGGDILEFRDKRADVDVLWHADHEWVPPGERYVPSAGTTTWTDHYPGGWQVNLPVAGAGRDIDGGTYGLHGESALIPWEATVTEDTAEGVALHLETDLLRYPFHVERDLRLPAGEPRLLVSETVENRGAVDLEYVWQHHVALGAPLLAPAARLDVPAERGATAAEDASLSSGRLAFDETFEWPHAPGRDGGTVDQRGIPPETATLHDQSFATDLRAGWYALTNPELDLGFGLTFPTDPFECVWYWQAFGGYTDSPFFGRSYNVGLEPTTAYPGSARAQRENGTMKTLEAGGSVTAEFTAVTYRGETGVESVSPDGTVTGR